MQLDVSWVQYKNIYIKALKILFRGQNSDPITAGLTVQLQDFLLLI